MLRRTFLGFICSAAVMGVGCTDMNIANRMGVTQQKFDAVQYGMNEAKVIEILGTPQKRMTVQGGEAGYDRQIILRWIGSNQIVIITLDSTGVIGKRKI